MKGIREDKNNMHRKVNQQGMNALEKLAKIVRVLALDIGARGSVKEDLATIKGGVDWLCFEPDENALKDEEERGWRSVHYISTAAGKREETFILNLYSHRGCSSKLTADTPIAARFSREGYFQFEKHLEIKARPLDELVIEHTKVPVSFFKIDVQGMEVECFAGARNLLTNQVVGIRTEVSFFPVYKDQPLFPEVDQALRPFGFQPMQWIEFHEWRRTTRLKLPELGPDPMPYSKGQMAHGDVLYLLQPEELRSDSEEQVKRLVRLGLIAVCYDLFDHAQAAFNRPGVRDYCRSVTGGDPVESVIHLSRHYAHRYKGFHLLVRYLLRRLLGKAYFK
jgi:FkbM family methyltransferase